MKPMKLLAVTLLTATALTACGPGQVVVVAEVDRLNPDSGEREVGPIANIQIQVLPFDRDAIFDSLTRAASSPEPTLPEALSILRDSVAMARVEWTESEAQWLAMRDRLNQISQEMERYNRAEPRYIELFNQFNEAERVYNQAEARKTAAFDRFDRLQKSTFEDIERFKVSLQAWEEDTFAEWGSIVQARTRQLKREVVYDTTDASGRATIAVPKGDWWIHGRYPAGTEELYWNVPVSVSGEPVEVRLNRGNAEARPIY